MRRNSSDAVYFIRPIGMQGPIKIGCSRSPDNRRKTLETWSPFALEIIAEIAGDTVLERRFHARFMPLHQRGEWFEWSPEIETVVEQINRGSFDVETLPEPLRVTHINGRDNSYSTPGWRYERSIASRCQALRGRGMPWREISEAELWRIHLGQATADEIAAARAHIEPIIASWTARFPPKCGRIRKAAA